MDTGPLVSGPVCAAHPPPRTSYSLAPPFLSLSVSLPCYTSGMRPWLCLSFLPGSHWWLVQISERRMGLVQLASGVIQLAVAMESCVISMDRLVHSSWGCNRRKKMNISFKHQLCAPYMQCVEQNMGIRVSVDKTFKSKFCHFPM